jgi:hypothetical protein
MIEALTHPTASEYLRSSSLAFIEASLGNLDRAFDWLERACAERDMPLLFARVDPQFDALRTHSRWSALELRVEGTRSGRV